MGGKEGTKKGHIIIFRARTARAYYNYNSGKRAYDICVQDADGKGTRSTRDEDRMRAKGKQCLKEEKTVVYGRESNGLGRRKQWLPPPETILKKE